MQNNKSNDKIEELERKLVKLENKWSFRERVKRFFFTIILFATPALVYSELIKPHIFADGDFISATTMNENFDALVTEINRLAVDVATNITAISTNTTSVATNATAIAANTTSLGTNTKDITKIKTDLLANTTSIANKVKFYTNQSVTVTFPPTTYTLVDLSSIIGSQQSVVTVESTISMLCRPVGSTVVGNTSPLWTINTSSLGQIECSITTGGTPTIKVLSSIQ